jgi:hypothetical protein
LAVTGASKFGCFSVGSDEGAGVSLQTNPVGCFVLGAAVGTGVGFTVGIAVGE